MAYEPRGPMNEILSDLAAIQALKGKVVRANDAFICCRSAENKLYGDISGALNSVLEFLTGGSSGLVLAFVAPTAPGTLVKFIGVTIAEALTLGAVVIVAWDVLASIATSAAALELLAAVGSAIGQLIATRPSSCYPCLSKKVLSQGAPRHREIAKINRRIGGSPP